MWAIKSLSKAIFGDTSKETILEIPKGQLYIVRPLSPKGYSELIYRDAVASIRRTTRDFEYHLVIQRAYEEGEQELEDSDEEAENLDKDEKTFLLDQKLRFRSAQREGGEWVLAWRDLDGDRGDLYEFVCDTSTSETDVNTFIFAAQECQYERKYRKSAQKATEQDMNEFVFGDEDPIPRASSLSGSLELQPTSKQAAEHMAKEVRDSKKSVKTTTPKTLQAFDAAHGQTEAPAARKAPEAREILTQKAAELHLFDFESGTFVQQDPAVIATVSEIGQWKYWLQITGSHGKEWLGQPVVADISPVFNFEYLSFIFNHYGEDGSAYSWLLRFKDQAALEGFQEGLMRALWEQLNQMKWSKVQEQEKDYVIEAFNDLTMDEANAAEEEEEGSEEEPDSPGRQSEHYDEDESDDDVELADKDGNANSQLAVGSRFDRSFVVRGSKIGVFRHLPNKNLEFSTNISKIETPNGKLFSPTKVMLHSEDQNMVMQDSNNPNSLYRMDLEYGKIVDEWKVHDDIPVTNFAPETKFAQQTANQPFVGHSRNALFRIDPRVAGNKLVEQQLKQYMSKNDFSAAATTEKGHIAVASDKGDVRLFDRIGVNAKTHIPALGEAIIGLDVSADGRWLLATCRTYLLLIDAMQKDGKNEGKLGFEKPFAKDSKPQPRRLAMKPEHVAQFQHETGAPLTFTPAKFNAAPAGQETSIITSTGPFLITWSLKKVVQGQRDPYQIKRYSDQVIADNFEFGSDKNVILALPNEVDMVSRKAFKRPTRESIAGDAASSRLSAGAFSTPRRSTRGRQSHLRSEIVNSPY
ncbi:Vacuolar import and degradation protein 27 [Exophiala xenobiotica]|uniref:Vacuolar import and degradation protein 27 n=1 Tax=Lithohypha guttulata TaxID=1690604 RepID=A0ABR0KDP4_9EURO|nr:Vacuolar import and degradation protein 27 [Lithohypha guttulata]KAK5312049.1 Vacuolar import and degradation protein 27 [Exophiala xenobiotica]